MHQRKSLNMMKWIENVLKFPVLRWLALIAYITLVFYLCFLPSDEVKSNDFLDKIYFDKWVHIMMYFGMWTLMVWAPKGAGSLQNQRQSFISAFLVALVVGIAIEYIQATPMVGRGKDFTDVVANCTGMLLAFLLWKKKENIWKIYQW